MFAFANRARPRTLSLPRRTLRVTLAVFVVYATLPGGLTSAPWALADGGDYSLDFTAAAPLTYDHNVGGGAFNDRTVGRSADIVESLEGGDFTCGEIISYLTQITVDDLSVGQNPHSTETIEIEYTLGAEATNGAPVGHIDVVAAAVNYGAVVNGAGAGGTDSGIDDDLGSTATIVSERYTSGATPDGGYPSPQEDDLIVTVQIDDLESFETIVLRLDVLLGCSPLGGIGNIQVKMTDKGVVAADGEPFGDAIPGGAQTIPFKSFGSGFDDPPVITVIKSNDADLDGTFTDTETADGVPVTVTYQVEITNTSTDAAVIDAASDDIHDITGSTCATLIGTIIDAGETLTCTFDVTFTADGQTVTNIFTASAVNEAGSSEDDDDSTVIIPDLLPAIVLEKTPSVSTLPETGGDVTFTVTVTNQSAEAVTLDSLTDDVFGDLNGVGSCSVPQTLAANGGTYECSFTEFLAGDPAAPHVNTVTGVASDDDGNQASDDDDAVVTFGNLVPVIEVTKVASVTSVPETGGDVTFTITTTNTGPTIVTIESIVDDVFGDLNGVGTCAVPQTLAIGESYQCSFTEFVTGDPDTPHANVVTVDGTDEDEDPVSDDDDETVDFDPVIDLEVAKVADPSSVIEGEATDFTITVTNQGPSAASGVVLTDTADAELDYVSHSGDGVYDAATGTWTVGDLAVGESKVLVITMLVTDAGSFLNVAEVTAADQPDIDSVPGDGQGDDYDEASVEALGVLASATIGDQVWLDADADGIFDAEEAGIAGATVRLENLDTGEVTQTTTNAEGMYLFAALDPGRYRVTSPSPGATLTRTTAASFEVTLADGDAFLTADFGWAGTLPKTGLEIETFAAAGLVMLLLGAALAFAGRRRTAE